MKHKPYLLPVAVLLVIAVILWMGVGAYSSSSAVSDLLEAMTARHGEPYTGKAVENGTEDMAFSVEPATFFPTNYALRNALGWDYRYQCTVTYTLHAPDGTVTQRTVTYTGIDPMGQGQETTRAYLEERQP